MTKLSDKAKTTQANGKKDRIISMEKGRIEAINIVDGQEIKVSYDEIGCMTCNEERLMSGQSGGCPVCDGLMTAKEYTEFENKYKKKKAESMFGDTIEPTPTKEKQPAKTTTKKPKSDKNPIIILLWGYDGTSKSEQILKFKPAPIVIDLENKLEPLAKKLNFPLENIIVASKYNEKYDISGPNTLNEIRNTLETIRERFKKGNGISAIALDGITDIRPYAVAEWLSENPSRQRPSTAGDWRDINDKVRDICFQMINIGRAEGISVFLTAQVGGEYVNNVRVRDIPDCKTWISHNVDHKFQLTRDDANKRFLAYCEKSYHDPFFSLDLTDWKHGDKPSLMNILQDSELVTKYRNEFENSEEEIVEKKKNESMF